MNGRILRIELRRAVGLGIAAIAVVLMLGLLQFLHGPWEKSPTAWTEQWNSLAGWQREQLTFLWPVALGAGALQGLRDSRSRMRELLTTTSLPTGRRIGPTVAAIAIWLTLGYLVVLLVGAVQVAGNTSYFHLNWTPIALVGILALIAAGTLGMGIGRLLPSRLTPPVVAVAGLVAIVVLTYAAPNTGRGSGSMAVALLAPGIADLLDPVHDVFTTIAGSVDLGQALWFAGLALAGLILLGANRPTTRIAAVIPAVLGLVAALLVLPSTETAAYAKDANASALVCAEGTPTVCVSRANQNRLAGLVGPARQALALLAALPNAPTEVVEDTRTGTGRPQQPLPPRNAVALNFGDPDFDLGLPGQSPSQLRLAVLASAVDPACVDPTNPADSPAYLRDRAAQEAVVDVLLGEPTTLPPHALQQQIALLERPAWQTLHSVPRDAQLARIAAARTAATTCHGDLLSILSNGTGSA